MSDTGPFGLLSHWKKSVICLHTCRLLYQIVTQHVYIEHRFPHHNHGEGGSVSLLLWITLVQKTPRFSWKHQFLIIFIIRILTMNTYKNQNNL